MGDLAFAPAAALAGDCAVTWIWLLAFARASVGALADELAGALTGTLGKGLARALAVFALRDVAGFATGAETSAKGGCLACAGTFSGVLVGAGALGEAVIWVFVTFLAPDEDMV